MSSRNPDHRPSRQYTTRHRVVAWINRRVFDNPTRTLRHGLIKDMRRRGGAAWLPEFISGSAETREEAFWRSQDLGGFTIYDVGAFHGLLTLFFALQSRQVISYEPNTGNHTRLTENLRRKVGLGAGPEIATIVASPAHARRSQRRNPGGRGSADFRPPGLSEEMFITTLDDDIREMSSHAPDYGKIDIRGAELAALRGARSTLLSHKSRLLLEMYHQTMSQKRKTVADIAACLQDLGYSDIRHIETGAPITRENSASAARGHLYCR